MEGMGGNFSSGRNYSNLLTTQPNPTQTPSSFKTTWLNKEALPSVRPTINNQPWIAPTMHSFQLLRMCPPKMQWNWDLWYCALMVYFVRPCYALQLLRIPLIPNWSLKYIRCSQSLNHIVGCNWFSSSCSFSEFLPPASKNHYYHQYWN